MNSFNSTVMTDNGTISFCFTTATPPADTADTISTKGL